MNPSIKIATGSLLDAQQEWIGRYRFEPRVVERGKVLSVGDGILWIEGLPSASIDEVLVLEDGSRAMVFHLTEELVGAILLEQTEKLAAGTVAHHSGMRLSTLCGDKLLGRVIDPLGKALDGQPEPQYDTRGDLDVASPPIISRDFVNRPLLTGNKIIDTLIPIGKGQRQLLIGDNGLGKSSLAMDVIVNQRNKNVLCVYVLVGQKRSSVLNTWNTLRDSGAMDYTVLVVAEATSLPGLQYLAPFAGCAVAEYWMKQGRDTLVVYDDLTAHAKSYRELSLLLRRPPGREAYPADIFFLHSRLLERSTCLAAKNGGGSMTALPIIETKEGEISSYIPTNLISITDGQIYFDSALFASGFLPAIDVTRSVSRVGGRAQAADIKQEAGRMKLDYLQFLELEVFTKFGARLEASIQKKLSRGRILREIFKQDRLSPLSTESQLAWLIAFNDNLFDNVKPEAVGAALVDLYKFAEHSALNSSVSRDKWRTELESWKKTRTAS
ncbi:MAG TPA: F0F1 ATP synthase subunit alpha [Candidatus Acidoferrales bacterium]|jgi:F-type H+-transporting ATPase subunit alpha|nr:F0F1 ATP synthase subunit alpha [Candidatus Acidoferrales bacterium]